MDDARPLDRFARLRSISGAALLADFAESRGLTRETILRDTGIRGTQLREPDPEITFGQEITLLRNVVHGVHDEPGLGLMAGMMCHPTRLGVLGFAIMTSPTMRHAAEVGLRYGDSWVTYGTHRFELRGDEYRITRDDSMVPADLRRFALEHDFAAIATVTQDMMQTRLPLVQARITIDPHPIYEMFATLLGVDRLDFSAAQSALIGKASTLDQPLPQGSAATARFYEQQCADILQRRRGRIGMSERVRQLLIRRGGVADQTHIAADLDLSVRTLRRRLADEGTTYRELSNETIGMLAEELLTAGLTVEHVATRLGYSSVSAFAAAFRAWKGQSPGQFARLHRGRITNGA
ncbi:AraC family transcriptional regulator [Nocardia sp. alder85J]|uniref:AraC family transcriptional regulator n=1 Tax=Nocardia sp. alder85J TaxID=2862949 RepID=UPI001CD588CE|nr:AraC family transcriptional regulator [Nocardia sp. alder85J]MCX4095386.1 AraC family transcriptional regulator ligand-binding domain-containing protein [Nocardia sp. alder85J]